MKQGTHVIAGVTPVQLQYDGDFDAAVERFFAAFPNSRIEIVNGRECIGHCEGCDRPIVDGGEYFRDCDGVFLCERCY